MAMVGAIVAGLAALAMLVFGVQILVAAFKTSVGWGLASLLLPFAMFVFVFKHWDQTRTPFLRWLICLPVAAVGWGVSLYGAMSGLPH